MNNKLLKAKIPDKNKRAFLRLVFNAENIASNYPEIYTTGIDLKKIGDKYFITDKDKIISKSIYFTDNEIILFDRKSKY